MLMFMTFCLLVRGSALVYLLIRVNTALPNGVLGCTAMICAVFATILYHSYASSIKRRDMEFAFILNCATILFNMFTLRYTVPATLNVFEYMAAGTLFEVVVCVVLVILSKQRTRMIMAGQIV